MAVPMLVSKLCEFAFNKDFHYVKFVEFFLVKFVYACLGRNLSLRSFYLLLIYFIKPHMPPRRDPANNNNNNQDDNNEAMMQQLMAAQTQLMTMMA